jgi:hypothetical protein
VKVSRSRRDVAIIQPCLALSPNRQKKVKERVLREESATDRVTPGAAASRDEGRFRVEKGFSSGAKSNLSGLTEEGVGRRVSRHRVPPNAGTAPWRRRLREAPVQTGQAADHSNKHPAPAVHANRRPGR